MKLICTETAFPLRITQVEGANNPLLLTCVRTHCLKAKKNEKFSNWKWFCMLCPTKLMKRTVVKDNPIPRRK